MLSDIEIAESAKLKDIRDVAAQLSLTENELELYGKYKAKLSLPAETEKQGRHFSPLLSTDVSLTGGQNTSTLKSGKRP